MTINPSHVWAGNGLMAPSEVAPELVALIAEALEADLLGPEDRAAWEDEIRQGLAAVLPLYTAAVLQKFGNELFRKYGRADIDDRPPQTDYERGQCSIGDEARYQASAIRVGFLEAKKR